MWANYADYLSSDHWKRTRDAARERVGNRCQKCGSDFRLCVHHETYVRRGRELPSDLTVLCKVCHKQVHGLAEEALYQLESRWSTTVQDDEEQQEEPEPNDMFWWDPRHP